MEHDSVPQDARRSGLFKEMPIPQMTGNTRTFSEIDGEEYATIKGEDEQAERGKVQQGYSKVGTLYRVAKDIGISYEWRTQGKYPEIKNRLQRLGRLAPNRLDMDLQHRITFGTATTYTNKEGTVVDISVGNTLALFATAHTLRGSSTTYRNRLANNPQFSQGALEAMELMRIQNTYNQFGEKMATMPDDVIWTTEDPVTVRTVKQMLLSTTDVSQNNPSVTSGGYTGKYRHVVLRRIATDKNGANDTTKMKYWGVACTANSTAYLGMHEEPRLKVPPVEGAGNEDFSSDSFEFGTRAGWLICIVSGSWIAVSTGDGSV